jgi:hypothetical protein
VAINLIVGAVTLLMAGFALVWVLFPDLRAWMEAPKYRFLEQERRFPEVVRESARPSHPPSGAPTPGGLPGR